MSDISSAFYKLLKLVLFYQNLLTNYTYSKFHSKTDSHIHILLCRINI